LVKEGQKVNAGQSLLVTEAMKMETEITAPIGGIVKAIYVAKGDAVNPNEVLVEIN
jgi:pyruvate carboxylase subunit B